MNKKELKELKGEMIGISLAMFFLGVLVGYLIGFFIGLAVAS